MRSLVLKLFEAELFLDTCPSVHRGQQDQDQDQSNQILTIFAVVMASEVPQAASESADTSRFEDYLPIFYVGHHESKRALPVSDFALRQAQDVGVRRVLPPTTLYSANKTQYDMLTTPITTPYFHSRVLSLLSTHLSTTESSDVSNRDAPPAPIIPPFNAVDTPLSPGETVSQLIGYCSPWIDLCSPDPLISNLSRQVLTMEIAYAAFCGVGNIIIPGPRNHNNSPDVTGGLSQYARAVQEALTVGPYVQMAIHVPMYSGEANLKEPIGDLRSLARAEYSSADQTGPGYEDDLYASWDSWNYIRTVCKYNSRLSVGKITNKDPSYPAFPSYISFAIPVSSCDPSEPFMHLWR